MIDIDLIYTTLDDVYSSENILDILVEFERVFDELDIYVYKNWIKGEIVEGPKVDRYWITVTLMYPHKLMPDPEAGKRLIDHGCKIWWGEDTLKQVGKIKGEESYEVDEKGRLNAKIVESPVWLVKISMPRHFVDEKKTEKVQTGNTSIDLDDVTDAYDENLNSDEVAKGNAADETTQQQNT
jgi:hypothetical protein